MHARVDQWPTHAPTLAAGRHLCRLRRGVVVTSCFGRRAAGDALRLDPPLPIPRGIVLASPFVRRGEFERPFMKEPRTRGPPSIVRRPWTLQPGAPSVAAATWVVSSAMCSMSILISKEGGERGPTLLNSCGGWEEGRGMASVISAPYISLFCRGLFAQDSDPLSTGSRFLSSSL
ncbi:hypothetical protein HPB50_023215 [Hyalomma asiaticum]|uniref:Uncharacterized protein n=1 Tax=Hyalomma asiaticum TaxID=266040 RepID=A0ACB7SSS1_HYAAI|nr:hypothetical protein HPB50_023215 [Hyalomma asiaticum]